MPQISVSSGVQEAYKEQYNQELSLWRELGAKYKADNIITVCRGQHFNKVIEVGAGDGSILMHLAQRNFAAEFHAIEISQSGIEQIARRNIPGVKSVQLFDGYKIPAPDNSFDLAILSHVLEHVEFPRLILRELKRISQYQVIEIPLDYAPDVDRKVAHFMSYGHIDVYTPTMLRFLLRTEGFELIADRPSRMSREVGEYSYYVNAKNPRTWRSWFRFWKAENLGRILWNFAGHTKRELMSNAYTVLCTKSESKLEILKD
jgi:ubiquinone/menaquinone biosynthesis C-methylase UbiE